MHGAVLNTRLRDHFLSNRRNVFVVAAHHDHLNAAFVRGVHMHARNDGFVVLVLLFCHASRQASGVMIKPKTHHRHTFGLA